MNHYNIGLYLGTQVGKFNQSIHIQRERSVAMPSQYKFTYFDLTGIGEPIRMLLHYGGIKFVDQRVTKDEWPALKSKTPLEQLPILEVDGKVLFQSIAIARFVASQVGLTGKNDMENWEIDAVVDTINDLKTKITSWFHETNEADKETQKETLDNEIMPLLLGKLDSWAAKNGGHLAVGKLTWADIFFVAITDFTMDIYGKNFVTEYPNLVSVRENVVSIPKIKTWIDQRPVDKWY